jgi:hypothetical protein
MTVGPTNAATPARHRWQFSLKALLLLVTHAAITSAVCVALYRWGLKEWPAWLLVFFVAWTAAVLGLILLSVLMVTGLVENASRRDGRLRGAVGWACVPMTAWLTFAGSVAITGSLSVADRNNWLACFGLTVVHLSLIAVPVFLRIRREDPREADQPLVILRLLCLAAAILPAVAALLCLVLLGLR